MVKFLAEWHLQRVGRWLTLLGFPTEIVPKLSKEKILYCRSKGCAILTTSRKWERTLKNLGVEYLILPNTEDWKTQLCMVLKSFGIPLDLKLNYCPLCLSPLKPVSRKEVKGKIPYYSYLCGKDFKVCPSCGRVYWIGGHQKLMKKTINEISQRCKELGL